MEHLLLGRVRGRPDAPGVCVGRQVLDVREDDVGRAAIVLVVLPPSDVGHVGGDACVDDDVFFPGVLVDGNASDDLEPMAVVHVGGNGPQTRMEFGQRKGELADLAERLVLACFASENAHGSFVFATRLELLLLK